MKILLTGCAGFIGAAIAKHLLNQNHQVIGIDNLNDYYDPKLKQARLEQFNQNDHFQFHKNDLTDKQTLFSIFDKEQPEKIIHMAAQPGVRYSIENPDAYVDSNLIAFCNVLEAARYFNTQHLVFASSSSVYGDSDSVPFNELTNTDHPVSLYAATKKSNELMAHAYAHLYNIPITGIRYFTVYGPWGRPDMAPFKFVKQISENKPITIFNHGEHQRDFTYIDDIVNGTLAILKGNHLKQTKIPCKIYNIGFGKPNSLLHFIETIEKAMGKTAIKEYQDKQPGDVEKTWADITALQKDIGYQPAISLEQGIPLFVNWYREFYKS